MQLRGEPFKGELHSADLSTAAEVPIYKAGSSSAHTIADDEYLRITHVEFQVTAESGDSWVIVGADGTPAASEYIIRGAYADNGGIVIDLSNNPYVSAVAGGKLYAKTTNAVAADVIVHGVICKITDTDRPSWKEAEIGG